MRFVTLAATLALSFVAGCDRPSEGDVVQFEIDCLEWQRKTAEQKFLDGPLTRDACLRYLNRRTEKQIEVDQKFHQKLIEDAEKQWSDYEKKRGHR